MEIIRQKQNKRIKSCCHSTSFEHPRAISPHCLNPQFCSGYTQSRRNRTSSMASSFNPISRMITRSKPCVYCLSGPKDYDYNDYNVSLPQFYTKQSKRKGREKRPIMIFKKIVADPKAKQGRRQNFFTTVNVSENHFNTQIISLPITVEFKK